MGVLLTFASAALRGLAGWDGTDLLIFLGITNAIILFFTIPTEAYDWILTVNAYTSGPWILGYLGGTAMRWSREDGKVL